MSGVILRKTDGPSFRLTVQDGIPIKRTVTTGTSVLLTRKLAAGAQGVPGSVWRNGTTAPSNGLGINGDYYLRVTNGYVYQKQSGTYVVIAMIMGPIGLTGPNNLTAATTTDLTGILVGDGANVGVLGYVPEDVGNKVTDFTTIDNTKYPTTQAASDNAVAMALIFG